MAPSVPIATLIQQQGKKAAKVDTNVNDLFLAVLKVVLFLAIGVFIYAPGTRMNHPVADVNITETGGTRWDTENWDWDFIDCVYFSMVTMTTVGYGDMPTLRQEMRLVTIVFGLVGVIAIAGSIGFIAEWCARAPVASPHLVRSPACPPCPRISRPEDLPLTLRGAQVPGARAQGIHLEAARGARRGQEDGRRRAREAA